MFELSKMSCFLASHQACCEKLINNILDDIKEQVKNVTILFYFQTVPEADYRNRLTKHVTPARVTIVTKDFDRAWDEAIDQVRRYKKRVIDREIGLNIIRHDIEFFLKHEAETHELTKRNLSVKISMIEEERQHDLAQKVEEIDALFQMYLEDLERKKITILEAEDYLPLVLEEIDNNICWLNKQRRACEKKFKEKVDCLVGDLINSSIVKTYKAGKNITLSILKLEEKMRQMRQEMIGKEMKEMESELCSEIHKLQQERSSLDYQAATLLDLENIFKALLAEQNEIFETMKRLEEEFNAKVTDLMCDRCVSEEDKQLEISQMRCILEGEISELHEREEKIHIKIERIRHELLTRHEGFDVELLDKIGFGKDMPNCERLKAADPHFKLYQFDQYGRFFINENGMKIYKSDNTSKAFLMDENGNLLEIRLEGSEVMFVSDSDYLKYHVGDALKKGMAQVFLYQPEDPISYLANYLVKYRQNVLAEEQRKKDLSDLLLRDKREC